MPEINSESVEVVTQAKESVVSDDATKTQENFVSKMFSLMNENPNYKMLGALQNHLLPWLQEQTH